MRFTVVLILFVQFAPSYIFGGKCTKEFLAEDFKKDVDLKTITVYTLKDSPPLVSQTKKQPPKGLDIDFLKACGAIWDVKFKYEYTSFDQFIPKVEANKDGISISSEFITKERMANVSFAQFVTTGAGFLVKSTFKTPITGYSSLCGLKVAVITGTLEADDVTAANKKCSSDKQIDIVPAAYSKAVKLVESGEVDVFPYDQIVLSPAVDESKGKLKLTGPIVDKIPAGILFNKKNDALGCALVNCINYLIDEGTYAKLLTSYPFTYKDNGVCPSRINLSGSTCEASCVPKEEDCKKYLK